MGGREEVWGLRQMEKPLMKIGVSPILGWVSIFNFRQRNGLTRLYI